MDNLRRYRILNMNLAAAYDEEAVNIALACENFIKRMGFKNYEYQCDNPQMARIDIFSPTKQKIGLYAVSEVK